MFYRDFSNIMLKSHIKDGKIYFQNDSDKAFFVENYINKSLPFIKPFDLDYYQFNILMLAILQGDCPMVSCIMDFLISNQYPLDKDIFCRKSTLLAAATENLAVLILLIERYKMPVNVVNQKGASVIALLAATSKNKIEHNLALFNQALEVLIDAGANIYNQPLLKISVLLNCPYSTLEYLTYRKIDLKQPLTFRDSPTLFSLLDLAEGSDLKDRKKKIEF